METLREEQTGTMDITAFKGYRYDSAVTGDAGRCIAPPYDVIEADQRENLYNRSEYNVVRITKGKAEPGDSDSENVYTRAAAAMEEFIDCGALRRDEKESIYVYCQDFSVEGRGYRRSGFIALGRLEDYGGAVRPHEHTLAGPKADRLELTRATKSQTGQIFVLYDEPAKTIDAILAQACKGEALLSSTDDEQVEHKLFAVTNPEQIEVIRRVMSEKTIFIADGHHRYETAVNYYKETQNPAAAWCMMTFVNTHNEGLVILPTHRLVKGIEGFDPGELLRRMEKDFDVVRLDYHDVVEKKEKQQMMFEALAVEFGVGTHAFGMYFNDGAFYVATLRDEGAMDGAAGDKSQVWRRLDVAILHKLVLEGLLGINEEALTAQSHVEYIKDFGPAALQAIDRIDRAEGQGVFFLNPTRAEEVEAVAETGEKMPQKSTFFYPKIFSGLVINRLVGES